MKRLQVSIVTLVLIAVAVMTGCTKNSESNKELTAQAREEPKPSFETMVIPAGTNVVASLDSRLTTETNVTGERFVATTTEPIVVDGKTVVPVGARIQGVLRDVLASGRVKGRARMTLVYEQIVDSAGKAYTISAEPLTLQAASETSADVEKITAGGVLGGIIGGIAGNGKGAAIGAGAGAGAGVVLMLANKGYEIELEPGQKLNVHMMAPTSIVVVAQK
jgi:hypothetical protein